MITYITYSWSFKQMFLINWCDRWVGSVKNGHHPQIETTFWFLRYQDLTSKVSNQVIADSWSWHPLANWPTLHIFDMVVNYDNVHFNISLIVQDTAAPPHLSLIWCWKRKITRLRFCISEGHLLTRVLDTGSWQWAALYRFVAPK